jgi:cytidyltransferase-like protein
MNIGIVAGSFKPYHAGHHKMVEIAAKNNDQVDLYVSLSSRGVRKIKDPSDERTLKQGARQIEVTKAGEHPIYGKDMRKVWEDHLRKILPPNVTLHLLEEGNPPIRKVYELLKSASEQDAEDRFTIYSDPVDIENNYSEAQLLRYLDQDFVLEKLDKVALDRNETVPVSGTDMRRHLVDGNEEAFKDMLPFQLSDASKQAIFDILSGKALQESLLRAFIRTAID